MRILKPTGGVYSEETKNCWLYSHPDKYRVNPSSFRWIVRDFLDQVYFSDEFTVFIGVVRVKTSRFFEEKVVDIKVRDVGGDFHHSMDIEYWIWEAINNVLNKALEKFGYKEDFRADIDINLESN